MNKNTALGASEVTKNIIFQGEMHKKFFLLYLPECRIEDVYHQALIYCLGISRDTREHVEEIYDFETGCVKTECMSAGWQTSGSLKIIRMAFNLYCNGTPTVYEKEGVEGKLKECEHYTVEDLFCCEYKDAYRAARTGKSAGSAGGAATVAGVENITVKAKIALKEIVKRNRAVFFGAGIFVFLFLIVAVSLGSCSASIQGGGSVIEITTYPGTDEDIYATENYYASLETALNEQINGMETTHPDYDEYQYNVSEIAHNPYHLISYLTAKYGDWKFEDIKDELQDLFEAQYHLNTEGKTETVTETKTVRVGESLGNVVTSGYCNCSICCGQWSGGPTASGVYPTANHTIAVDASDPFVPMGTKIAMNGVEYTVEDALLLNWIRQNIVSPILQDGAAEKK